MAVSGDRLRTLAVPAWNKRGVRRTALPARPTVAESRQRGSDVLRSQRTRWPSCGAAWHTALRNDFRGRISTTPDPVVPLQAVWGQASLSKTRCSVTAASIAPIHTEPYPCAQPSPNLGNVVAKSPKDRRTRWPSWGHRLTEWLRGRFRRQTQNASGARVEQAWCAQDRPARAPNRRRTSATWQRYPRDRRTRRPSRTATWHTVLRNDSVAEFRQLPVPLLAV